MVGNITMRSIEFTEEQHYLDQLKKYAKVHYGESDEMQAILMYLARATLHGEEDDRKQYEIIQNLKREVELLKSMIGSQKQSSMPQSTVQSSHRRDVESEQT